MKSVKKTIKIEIDYFDTHDIEVAMNHVRDLTMRGRHPSDEGKISNPKYKFNIKWHLEEYREEEINGIWYIVIPSSIKSRRRR